MSTTSSPNSRRLQDQLDLLRAAAEPPRRPEQAQTKRRRSARGGSRATRAAASVLEVAPSSGAVLVEIERIISEFAVDRDEVREAARLARRRALTLMVSTGADAAAETRAAVEFAAEMLAALAPELTGRQDSLTAMIDRVAVLLGVPRPILGRDVLRATPLLQLRPVLAVEVVPALVLALVRGRAAVLWAPAPAGELVQVAGAGDLVAAAEASRAIAAKVLAGETVTAPGEGEVAACAWQDPAASLVVFGESVLSPGSRLILEAAEPLLRLALARRQASAGACGAAGTAGGGSVEHDAERRLSRVRFDLHDGPQQDVIMLAEDLRLFRDQLERLGGGHPALLGRVDDLEARLIALDGDLRRISVSVQSPFLHQKSLRDALADLIRSFEARTGITPAVTVSGDFGTLTDSQHITLLGLIREALSNVREHSQAEHVGIQVSAEAGGVTASVTDDGRGFDPETVLVSAARRGRLGLVGMHERVRLLGGTTTITSRPGGPTVIATTLPPAPESAPRHG